MRSTLKRALFATTVAAAAFGFATTSASATALATWTVTNPTGTFSASLKSGTVATLIDSVTTQRVDCSTASASGTATSGTYATGTGLAKITGATFGSAANPCPGPLGSSFTAVLASGSTISVNGSTYSSGVTKGTLSDVRVNLTGDTILGICEAVITGSASNVTYTNSTGELDINNGAGLTVESATNCSGLLNTGDAATFDATYKLVTPITITSP